MSKTLVNVSKHLSLAESKLLNNSIKCGYGWVYNRFLVLENAQRKVLEDDSTEVIMRKFEEFRACYNTELKRTEKLDHCWELHPIDRFDSGEQIEHLITKGEFYYAPFND